MSRLGQNSREARQSYRAYKAANREDWKEIGFVTTTVMVAAEEKDLVLAEMEVRKFEKLCELADDKNTDKQVLTLMSTRNMSKLPISQELEQLLESVENHSKKTAIEQLLDDCKRYKNKYRGLEAQYENVKDEDTKLQMLAKAVAYTGLAAALYRLARETANFYPAKSVFGAQEKEGLG